MTYLLVGVVFARTLCDLSFKIALVKCSFDSVDTLKLNVLTFLKSPFLYLGILFGGLNFLLWSLSLTQFDLSYAYPFLSISYLTIMISSRFLFNEHIGPRKVVGLGFIVLGTFFLFL